MVAADVARAESPLVCKTAQPVSFSPASLSGCRNGTVIARDFRRTANARCVIASEFKRSWPAYGRRPARMHPARLNPSPQSRQLRARARLLHEKAFQPSTEAPAAPQKSRRSGEFVFSKRLLLSSWVSSRKHSPDVNPRSLRARSRNDLAGLHPQSGPGGRFARRVLVECSRQFKFLPDERRERR